MYPGGYKNDVQQIHRNSKKKNPTKKEPPLKLFKALKTFCVSKIEKKNSFQK